MKISKSKIVLIVIALVAGVVYSIFYVLSIQIPSDYKMGMNKFKSQLDSIPIENRVGATQNNLNPSAGKSGATTCSYVTTSHFDGGSETKKTCSVLFSYYFGSNEADIKVLLNNADSRLTNAGWQYITGSTSKIAQIFDIANQQDSSEKLKYVKNDQTIYVTFVRDMYLPKVDNSCPGSYSICKDLRRFTGPKYAHYLLVESFYQKTY